MSGVGDEPALFFIALCHRANDPLGQDQQKQKDSQQPRQRHQDAGNQGRPEIGEASPAVHEDEAGTFRFCRADIAVVPLESAGASAGPYRLRHLAGALIIHGGDLPRVALEDLPFFIQKDRKKAGFKWGLRRDPMAQDRNWPRLSPPVVRWCLLREYAPVFAEQRQDAVRIPDHFLIAHGVDPAQDHQQHQGQRQHGGGDEFHPQLLDHVRTSSEYPRLRLARISTSACRAVSFFRR